MKYRMRTIMLILLTMLLLCPIQVLAADGENAVKTDLEDGEYSIQVELEGGSGKASVSSPTLMLVKEGKMYARLQWSSSNYDYMIVDGEKYLNESEEGRNSVFTVPVTALDDKMEVIADTLAMGAPHEIDYTLTFYEASIGSKGQLPQEAAKRVVAVALVIIIGGGILNYFVNKRNRCSTGSFFMPFRIIYIITNMYKDGRKGTSWIQYRIKPTKQFIIHCGRLPGVTAALRSFG